MYQVTFIRDGNRRRGTVNRKGRGAFTKHFSSLSEVVKFLIDAEHHLYIKEIRKKFLESWIPLSKEEQRDFSRKYQSVYLKYLKEKKEKR